MKAQFAAAVAAFSTAVSAQFSGNGNLPSCANNCANTLSGSNFQNGCKDSNQISSYRTCITSACSSSDQQSAYNWLGSACQSQAGVTIAPFSGATGTITSFSSFPSVTGGPFNGGSWGPNGWSVPATLSSAWSSFTSAHPNPNSADWSSFYSQYSTAWPYPTGGPWGGAGGWGGFGFGSGAGGWKPGNGSPFGASGYGPFGGSAGPWTSGAWTSWWGGDKCPASDWPGWTSGAWSTKPDWTTWTACTATTTGQSVFTTTINGTPTVGTSYGFQVAQAVSTGTGNAAPAATQKAMAGGAAAAAFIGAVLAL